MITAEHAALCKPESCSGMMSSPPGHCGFPLFCGTASALRRGRAGRTGNSSRSPPELKQLSPVQRRASCSQLIKVLFLVSPRSREQIASAAEYSVTHLLGSYAHADSHVSHRLHSTFIGPPEGLMHAEVVVFTGESVELGLIINSGRRVLMCSDKIAAECTVCMNSKRAHYAEYAGFIEI